MMLTMKTDLLTVPMLVASIAAAVPAMAQVAATHSSRPRPRRFRRRHPRGRRRPRAIRTRRAT